MQRFKGHGGKWFFPELLWKLPISLVVASFEVSLLLHGSVFRPSFFLLFVLVLGIVLVSCGKKGLTLGVGSFMLGLFLRRFKGCFKVEVLVGLVF
jgi:hypothetical protein